MDDLYHPGVWRSIKYSCCYAVNKRAKGCTPTTGTDDDGTETEVKKRLSTESAMPGPVLQIQCKNFCFFVLFWLVLLVYRWIKLRQCREMQTVVPGLPKM